MHPGIRLGRWFGIEISLDWSWVFIAVLLSWNLTAVFAHWHPQWGPWLSLSVAICAALLFFGSVLAHELSHSLVAQRFGIPVRSITLWLFGGVSSFEHEPPSPRAEFWSAVVGPLTSLALGVIFMVLGGWSAWPVLRLTHAPVEAMASLGPLSTLLLWLGPVNVMLGLFNLVPAFPLDGGRLLRSALWAGTHDLRKATRRAATVSHGVAWAFIVAGLAMAFGARVPFFGTGVLNGLWLSFIGWFLNSAAAQSYRQLVVHDLLAGVPVARLMRTDAVAVSPAVSVGDLVHGWMLQREERAFPVVREGVLLGMVALDDVRKVPREEWDRTTVEQIMTPAYQLAATDPTQDAAEAMATLSRRNVTQLPVLAQGRLVGMLTARDLVRWLDLQSEPDVRWRERRV